MTDFKEIERLYDRYFNFEKEIKTLMDEENYEEAASQIANGNDILMTLARAKKTAKELSEEEILKISSYDKIIKENNKSNIQFLTKYQNEIGEELGKTKKKVKISTAYSMQTSQKQGVFLDVTE